MPEDSLLFEAIVDTLREPLLVLDQDLRVRKASRAFYEIFDLAREEVDGIPLFELRDGEWENPRLETLLRETVVLDHTVDAFEVVHHFPTIGKRVMLLNARRIVRDSSEEAMILVAMEDITERKHFDAERRRFIEELGRSNAELQRFAYVASHDLQEPLRMVTSYTQLLARKYEDQLDEKAQRFITYAVEGAARMQVLINDLLTYSRLGSTEREPERVDLEDLLQHALKHFDDAIAQAGAIVTHDPLPTVVGNSSELVRVIQNLLSNAIKFRGDAPPRIHLGAQRNAYEWTFSVRDNGIGIEPAYFDRVFIVFQRLHTRAEHPGTGIGLAICKKIIERHGGTIWVESSNGGSTFKFTLPVTAGVEE